MQTIPLLHMDDPSIKIHLRMNTDFIKFGMATLKMRLDMLMLKGFQFTT